MESLLEGEDLSTMCGRATFEVGEIQARHTDRMNDNGNLNVVGESEGGQVILIVEYEVLAMQVQVQLQLQSRPDHFDRFSEFVEQTTITFTSADRIASV
jgi:hypothetical protein